VTDPCDCRVAMYGSIWADRSVRELHLASRDTNARGSVWPWEELRLISLLACFCNDMDGPERERWMSNVQ
jgi:hypothetical protein